MSTRKPRHPAARDEAAQALPFDVTQDIDPALADLMRRSAEPTLSQADFDELDVKPPPSPRR